MLAETRAELDDFHHSSKELEEELEKELERTEKAQQDLKIKVAKAEQERDDWKVRVHVACITCGVCDSIHPVQIHVSSNNAQYDYYIASTGVGYVTTGTPEDEDSIEGF